MTTVRLTNAVVSALADALDDAANAGSAAILEIYDGAIPTNADTAVGAQVKLATLTFNATAFGAASNGVITAAAITSDSSADATGTAAWARMLTQGAGTTIMDLDVGTSAASIIVNTVSFTAGSAIACSSFVITMPKT